MNTFFFKFKNVWLHHNRNGIWVSFYSLELKLKFLLFNVVLLAMFFVETKKLSFVAKTKRRKGSILFGPQKFQNNLFALHWNMMIKYSHHCMLFYVLYFLWVFYLHKTTINIVVPIFGINIEHISLLLLHIYLLICISCHCKHDCAFIIFIFLISKSLCFRNWLSLELKQCHAI